MSLLEQFNAVRENAVKADLIATLNERTYSIQESAHDIPQEALAFVALSDIKISRKAFLFLLAGAFGAKACKNLEPLAPTPESSGTAVPITRTHTPEPTTPPPTGTPDAPPPTETPTTQTIFNTEELLAKEELIRNHPNAQKVEAELLATVQDAGIALTNQKTFGVESEDGLQWDLIIHGFAENDNEVGIVPVLDQEENVIGYREINFTALYNNDIITGNTQIAKVFDYNPENLPQQERSRWVLMHENNGVAYPLAALTTFPLTEQASLFVTNPNTFSTPSGALSVRSYFNIPENPPQAQGTILTIDATNAEIALHMPNGTEDVPDPQQKMFVLGGNDWQQIEQPAEEELVEEEGSSELEAYNELIDGAETALTIEGTIPPGNPVIINYEQRDDLTFPQIPISLNLLVHESVSSNRPNNRLSINPEDISLNPKYKEVYGIEPTDQLLAEVWYMLYLSAINNNSAFSKASFEDFLNTVSQNPNVVIREDMPLSRSVQPVPVEDSMDLTAQDLSIDILMKEETVRFGSEASMHFLNNHLIIIDPSRLEKSGVGVNFEYANVSMHSAFIPTLRLLAYPNVILINGVGDSTEDIDHINHAYETVNFPFPINERPPNEKIIEIILAETSPLVWEID